MTLNWIGGAVLALKSIFHIVFVSLPERSKGSRLGRDIFVCTSSNLVADICPLYPFGAMARPLSKLYPM